MRGMALVERMRAKRSELIDAQQRLARMEQERRWLVGQSADFGDYEWLYLWDLEDAIAEVRHSIAKIGWSYRQNRLAD